MSVTVEQTAGEPIFIATFGTPFDAQQDIKAMFTSFIPLRAPVKGKIVLILDLSILADDTYAFSHMVMGMGEAGAQIKANKMDPTMSPPQIIMIGTDTTISLAAESLTQAQYGGSKARVCTQREDAMALARTMLAE